LFGLEETIIPDHLEAQMNNSYLEWEVPTSVEEEHNDVNEEDILGLTDNDIEFQCITKMRWFAMSRDMTKMISKVMVNMESTRR
jgi:hypothetical protein